MTVPAVAAVVVAVVAVIVVGITPSTAPSAAAEVLLAAADQAEASPVAVTTTVPVGGTASDMPGIRWSRWESGALVTFSFGLDEAYTAMVHSKRETWVAPDGSGRIAEEVLDIEFLSDEDRIGWGRLGGDLRLAINEEYGPGSLDYQSYGSLPTDPDKLRNELLAVPHGDWSEEVGLLWSVEDVLRDGGAPPELRAALFRVAAGIDGIELVGEVTDRVGRPGIAVALEYEGNGLVFREWMIFDPETASLLGTEKLLLTATPLYRAEPPLSVSWVAYLDDRVVDRVP